MRAASCVASSAATFVELYTFVLLVAVSSIKEVPTFDITEDSVAFLLALLAALSAMMMRSAPTGVALLVKFVGKMIFVIKKD